MSYIDTSVVLAMFLKEQKTTDAWRWFDRQAIGTIFVSNWTLVEVTSALSIKRRMNRLDDEQHQNVLTRARYFAQRQCAIISLDAPDFRRAAELCDGWQSGLRAGDALHVAISERHQMTICTLDKIMHEAAITLGMSVESP